MDVNPENLIFVGKTGNQTLERNKRFKKTGRLPTFNLTSRNKNSEINLTRSSLKLFNLIMADIFKDVHVLGSGIFGQ